MQAAQPEWEQEQAWEPQQELVPGQAPERGQGRAPELVRADSLGVQQELLVEKIGRSESAEAHRAWMHSWCPVGVVRKSEQRKSRVRRKGEKIKRLRTTGAIVSLGALLCIALISGAPTGLYEVPTGAMGPPR